MAGGVEELLRERIVILAAGIDDTVANTVIAQLLFLEHEGPDQPVRLALSSIGGQVSSSLAIYDTITSLSCPVHTIALGQLAGTALLLVAAGARGHRIAHPNARLAMTPIRATILASVAELERTEQMFGGLLADATGQSIERVREDLRAGLVFDADAARAYGLVDRVERVELR